MGLSIQRRTNERAWKKADYKKNPEKYRARSRTRRRRHGDAINERRRELAAWRRGRELRSKAQEARAKLGREPQTLNEWFPTQATFSEWAQLARAVGVSRRTVLDWRTGKHPPVRGRRRRLYEITGLACFADAARWEPRERAARTMGEEKSVPLLVDLVVRCGLATREILQIRVSQVEEAGIRLASGRFISFGDGWERVSRAAVDAWRERAKPTGYLFFSRKPVDRSRPGDGVWIWRSLRASGLSLRQGQAARLRHFAGDFARFTRFRRRFFLRHLQEVHGLSRTGAFDVYEALRDRLAFLRSRRGELRADRPGAAFDALYPPVGPRPVQPRRRKPKRPKPADRRRPQIVYREVEQEIAALVRQRGERTRAVLIAARQVVAARHPEYEAGVIAKYHEREARRATRQAATGTE
jgi:transcriptional regulator with XRE-family HTH domain